MSTKLITTKDRLLLIDEEAEIKDCYYYNSLDKALRKNNNLNLSYHHKVVAYYPLTKDAKELDLPLLPNPFKTYRVGRKQKRAILDEKGVEIGVFKTGSELEAQKYCDYLNGKQFSLEDIREAIEMARKTFPTDKLSCDRYSTEEIIQSLSTQQLPVGFEPEYKKQFIRYDESVASYKGEGFLADSEELKTIINSEGKEELVGTYKY